MDISVVIATRNRAAKLEACLRSFESLDSAGASWELVVVDNGSCDSTMDVARRTAAAAPWELKLIAEPAPGVSRARNRGVAASRGGIIVFLDDDCYISPEFFRETLRIFGDPSIGFAGGRALPFDETDQPVSIFPMTELKRFPARGAILPGEMPGSGMAVRRAAWDDAGGYDEAFGPGAPLLASEDVDLQQRLLGAGWEGLFDPRLWIYHHHGRKQEEAEQSYRAYDISVGALYMKRMVHGPARTRYLKRAYWEFRSDLQRGRGRRYPRMFCGALLYAWTSATRMVRG